MGKSMSPESIEALQALAREREITIEILLSALAEAIETGYKSQPGSTENSWVTIDPSQMEIRVMSQDLDENGEPVGEELDITPEDFGRIATQATRHVLTQGIKDVEREKKYEEYRGREGEVVTGIVQQSDARYTILDLGRVEALLPLSEQVAFEKLENGARLKVYIVEVRQTTRGPQVVVSRTHPGLIKRLFELEVPEIGDGIVEVMACAREPGHRTKIAVYSHDQNVDPVGACVGASGARVRPIVNELMGEKIDIVPYANDLVDLVTGALAPAKVREVTILEEAHTAEVTVPDQQLSLAIGREGQNARLAARLTGFSIDIRSESQVAQERSFAETEWEGGEWILDSETNEHVFMPADGGKPIKAEEWAELAKLAEGEKGESAENNIASDVNQPSEADEPEDPQEPETKEDVSEPPEPADEPEDEPKPESSDAESK